MLVISVLTNKCVEIIKKMRIKNSLVKGTWKRPFEQNNQFFLFLY